jgi:hypothetical protein
MQYSHDSSGNEMTALSPEHVCNIAGGNRHATYDQIFT